MEFSRTKRLETAEMRVLRPYQLTVLATSQCNARCAHCSMNSAPDRKGERLSFAEIRKAIDQLHSASPLRVVIFAGGEPTLLGNDLLDSIAHCDSLGIVSRLVTNAYWARTPESARMMLIRLREAGLMELNISCDDYHLPFIPADRIKTAWMASKGLGFLAVILATCSGPGSVITPESLEQLIDETLPRRFDDDGYQRPLYFNNDETYYAISNSQVQLLGRGVEELDRSVLVFRDADADDVNERRLSGGCQWAIQSAALSPRNHLVACCGTEAEGNPILDFGSLNNSDANNLAAYADDNVLVNAIAFLGPKFLKDYVKRTAPEIAWRERYSTVCEICEHVLKRPEVVKVLNDNIIDIGARVWAARSPLELDKHPVEPAI